MIIVKRQAVYLLLASFILVGAWFRLHGILDGAFSFTYDVGRDMLSVADIVLRRNLTLLGPTTGLEGFFMVLGGITSWLFPLFLPLVIQKGWQSLLRLLGY